MNSFMFEIQQKSKMDKNIKVFLRQSLLNIHFGNNTNNRKTTGNITYSQLMTKVKKNSRGELTF